ncbi:DMT family transporter [Thiohalophilus sp.]|uniref:DMT family transporter n=1 Tax=Thiohalophilus sp. TaxID=3028392 RepID=UPI0039769CB7
MGSIGDSDRTAKLHAATPVFGLLLAATLWGVFWFPLRWLEESGLSGLWQTFFIYTGTLWVVIILLWRQGMNFFRELRLAPWPLLFMVLASGVCNTSFILAMLEGEVMRVLLLFYLSPLWATLIGWLFLKEELHILSIGVLIVAIGGAVVMLWHPGMGYPWPAGKGDWLALVAGVSFAILNSLVRFTDRVSIPVKTSVTWFGAILVSGALIVFSDMGLPEVSFQVVGYAWLIGALMMVIMTFSVVYGVTHMPVHRSSVILLFELVAGAASSQWLTEEIILPKEWIGGILIVIAAWLSARRQLQNPDKDLIV